MKYKGVLISEISLFSHPAIYLELLLRTVQDLFKALGRFVVRRALLLGVAMVAWAMIAYLPQLQTVEHFLYFALYWVILGVASSIGLGTGLHTFVLYLGPHIAKVAIASTHCGYVPEMFPSRWKFDHFDDCQGKFQDS
jgi:vacuole membrane protein 1